jgi:hypothetical protein
MTVSGRFPPLQRNDQFRPNRSFTFAVVIVGYGIAKWSFDRGDQLGSW